MAATSPLVLGADNDEINAIVIILSLTSLYQARYISQL